MKIKQKVSDCLLVVKRIRLNKDDYWSWFKYFFFGTIIIPIFYILLIEATAEVSQYVFDVRWSFLDPTNEFSLSQFRIIELVFLLVYTIAFWVRCHIKVYSLNFTRYAENQNRYNKHLGSSLCSRCGEPWEPIDFTNKQTFQTGEKTWYYKDYPLGYDSYPKLRKKVDPIYKEIEVEERRYQCQKQYCGFSKSSAASFGRMSLMPYKIADTVSYALKTDSTERYKAGNVLSYKRGISVFWYCIFTILLCFAGNYFNLRCYNLRHLDFVLVPLWGILMETLAKILIVAMVAQFPLFVLVKLYFYRKKRNRKKNRKTKAQI